MRILGLDPGSRVCGYGVIDELDGELVTGLGSSVEFRPAPFRLHIAA